MLVTVVSVDTLEKRNGRNGNVLKVQTRPESGLVYVAALSLGTHKKKTSASLKPEEADKRAGPCIVSIQDLGVCPCCRAVCVPVGRVL